MQEPFDYIITLNVVVQSKRFRAFIYQSESESEGREEKRERRDWSQPREKRAVPKRLSEQLRGQVDDQKAVPIHKPTTVRYGKQKRGASNSRGERHAFTHTHTHTYHTHTQREGGRANGRLVLVAGWSDDRQRDRRKRWSLHLYTFSLFFTSFLSFPFCVCVFVFLPSFLPSYSCSRVYITTGKGGWASRIAAEGGGIYKMNQNSWESHPCSVGSDDDNSTFVVVSALVDQFVPVCLQCYLTVLIYLYPSYSTPPQLQK